MSDHPDDRRVTRSSTRDVENTGWLSYLPAYGAAARRERSRSPSVRHPSVEESLPDVTPPATPAMAEGELTTALAGLSFASRKPDLPAFDKKNVDIWVRRVENAYIRANVTSPRDKFAYMETKFGVDTDPNINRFLYGDPTAEKWDEFIAYLKDSYGKSVRDKTAAVLDRIPRDGRRPSALASLILDRMDNVTLDQIAKEKVLRELPNDIRLAIANSVKNLSLAETVKIADDYFTRDGQPIYKSGATVNEVRANAQTEEDDAEVNAVRNGARPKQRDDRSKSRGARSKSRPKENPDWCFFHNMFGSKARNCRDPCKFSKAPKDQGPRRT